MTSRGPRSPLPPADILERELPVFEPDGLRLFRVSLRSRPEAVFFSRLGRYRFDFENAPLGVCYFALSRKGAIKEFLGRWLLDNRAVPAKFRDASLYEFEAKGLRLFDMTGEDLTVFGATSQVLSGSYAVSRKWAEAAMDHPRKFNGILYRGRVCGSECVALFGLGKGWGNSGKRAAKFVASVTLENSREAHAELIAHRTGFRRRPGQ